MAQQGDPKVMDPDASGGQPGVPMNGMVWVNNPSEPNGGHYEFATSTSAPGGLPLPANGLGIPGAAALPVGVAGTLAATKLIGSQGPQTPKTNSSSSNPTVLGLPTSIWGDILGAVTGLVGTKLATNASGDATRAQLEALDRATALQREMYQQSRSDQLPWLRAGTGALSLLSQGLGLPNVDVPTTMGAGAAQTPKPNPLTAANPGPFATNPDGQGASGNFSLRQIAGLPPSTGQSGTVNAPQAQPSQGTVQGSMNGAANSQMAPVPMRTPSGGLIQVPESMVAEAESRGATRA